MAGLRLRLPGDAERLARLGDDLGGHHARCSPATGTSTRRTMARTPGHERHNVPKPIQRPRVPIMVGGNGPNVTWRLAARHADELNLDGMSPAEVAEAMPVIRARCEEIGRDPATLPVSVHIWWGDLDEAGAARVDLLAGHREAGVSRVMGLVQASATTDEAFTRWPRTRARGVSSPEPRRGASRVWTPPAGCSG